MFIKKTKYFVKGSYIILSKLRYPKILKQIIPVSCKRYLKRIISSDEKECFDYIDNITTKLYNLGFTERPLRELLDIKACSQSGPLLRNKAIKELARWYLNSGDEKGLYYAQDLLSLIINEENDPRKVREYSLLKSKCLKGLGKKESGQKVLLKAIRLLGTEPNLLLAAANFEQSLSDRFNWVNKTFKYYGLAPITVKNVEDECEVDSLKYCLVFNKKEKQPAGKCPLVSVILTTYNEQETVSTALESILNQTWNNIEIIVNDDYSSDKTVEIVEHYARLDSRIILLKSEKNNGLFFSRNKALKNAKGEFVTTHDADDWSHPEKIEIQVKHLMKNPLIVGNTSQMVQTTSDLNFYRKNHYINLISDFPCSFMFRRVPVMQTVGYWDCVRFGADNEFIRRIMKRFGSNSVVNLKTGPLTFYRQSSETLTGNQKFGYPGYYMGIRKEYYEAQTHFHNKAENLYYSFPQKNRPFPVPEPMWIDREAGGEANLSYRYFDLVFVSDFRQRSKYLDRIVAKITKLKNDGNRVGLVQMYCYEYDPKTHLASNVREMLDGDMIQMVVYGEKVFCNTMIICYPPVLMEKQRYVPHVKAKEINILATHAPAKSNIEYKKLYYDIERCERNLHDYFGKHAKWYALADSVLEDFYRYHSNELKEITISNECLLNCL